MTTFTCDSCDTNTVDTGSSNPSLVLCAACNHGVATWNCVDTGNHSCDCDVCEPPACTAYDGICDVCLQADTCKLAFSGYDKVNCG